VHLLAPKKHSDAVLDRHGRGNGKRCVRDAADHGVVEVDTIRHERTKYSIPEVGDQTKGRTVRYQLTR
jgi:hypothetical protein